MADIKPRYEVHKIPGTAIRKRNAKRKDGTVDITSFIEEEVDAGFMVYFPSGASMRCWDEKHLKSMGFNEPASLIDMDTGDEMGKVHPGVLKSRSEQKTSTGRNPKSGLNLEGDDS